MGPDIQPHSDEEHPRKRPRLSDEQGQLKPDASFIRAPSHDRTSDLPTHDTHAEPDPQAPNTEEQMVILPSSQPEEQEIPYTMVDTKEDVLMREVQRDIGVKDVAPKEATGNVMATVGEMMDGTPALLDSETRPLVEPPIALPIEQADLDEVDDDDTDYDDPWFDAACLTSMDVEFPLTFHPPKPVDSVEGFGTKFTFSPSGPPGSSATRARVGSSSDKDVSVERSLQSGTVGKSGTAREPFLNLGPAPDSLRPKTLQGTSFATANGAALLSPSEEARKKIANLFSEDDSFAAPNDLESAPGGAQPLDLPFTFTSAAGKRLAEPSEEARKRIQALFADDSAPESWTCGESVQDNQNDGRRATTTFSFTTASGVPAPGPSEASKAKIAAMWGALGGGDPSNSKDNGLLPGLAAIKSGAVSDIVPLGFETGAGKTIGQPSDAAKRQAMTLFNEEVVCDPVALQNPVSKAVLPDANLDLSEPRLQVLATRKLALDVAQAKDNAADVPPFCAHDQLRDHSALPPSSSEAVEQAKPLQKSFIVPFTTKHTAIPARLNDPSTSKFKTPLKNRPVQDTIADHSTPETTPVKIVASVSSSLPTRVAGLGMTPRAKPNGKKSTPFVTPFKAHRGGMPGFQPRKISKSTSFTVPANESEKVEATITSKANLKTESVGSCFDLSAVSDRKTMQGAHLKPLYFQPQELEDLEVPPEIVSINSNNGIWYQFDVEGVSKGFESANTDLLSFGCSLSTSKWTKNHWSLILWKLASIVRSKPDLFYEKWSYGEVLRQLKYRYQREFNLAQRSALKRITERDSSAGLPMVLCVSDIGTLPVEYDLDGKAQPQQLYLELTDGWYRLRAQIDDVLSRAVQRDRIRLGYKLGVTGARVKIQLESSNDGIEILDALERCFLKIGSNGTSVVRWDRKMGFVHQPFISALSSLSPLGGVVPIMDIKIIKVFPIAFIYTNKDKHVSPWSEAEEYAQQDQWREKWASELARLQTEFQSTLVRLSDDLERIAQVMENFVHNDEEDEAEIEESILEMFHKASNKSHFLKSLPAFSIRSLARKAREEIEYESSRGRIHIEGDLQRLCPPRETRSFQVLRFDDARLYERHPARVGQLQVWDVKAAGQDVWEEGVRYRVSNLMPARPSGWCGPKDNREVFLSTRRDTVWKKIE